MQCAAQLVINRNNVTITLILRATLAWILASYYVVCGGAATKIWVLMRCLNGISWNTASHSFFQVWTAEKCQICRSWMTRPFFSWHHYTNKISIGTPPKKHTVILPFLKIPHSQLGFEDSKAAEAGKDRRWYQQMIVIRGHRTVCKAWHPCVSNFFIDSIWL